MAENAPSSRVVVPAVLTVKQLADALRQPVTAIIAKLIRYGVLATINEDIDWDTAAIVADEFGVLLERETNESQTSRSEGAASGGGTLQARPPVVTIMGHVDHGKTTLLDTIRSTNVAAKESGGITQHIGSYQIEVTPKGGGEPRLITFLDTPGHAAFEAMRRHGAQITDLVVLVVAADDGVKPQTIEAINHARALQVPIIVAINKVDKPDADLERVKAELSEYDLVAEEWGGKTVVVPISAKVGTGVPELLELILLATDLRTLQAAYDVPAIGVVIESHMQPGIGAVATILIQNGTLRVGDFVAIGGVSGRVRTLTDYHNKKVVEATPSMPVEISGLSAVPNFGEQLVVCASEKDARDAARQHLRSSTAKRATLTQGASGASAQKEGERSILNVVIKADTNGSLEAIRTGLQKYKSGDVEVRIVSEGVGDISENDITMAATSHGEVIGFQVRLPALVKQLSDRQHVHVSLYSVIYELFDSVRTVLANLMPMIELEEVEGNLKVLKTFRDVHKHPVVGGRIQEGVANAGSLLRVMRGEKEVLKGKLISIRQGKDEVKQGKSGSEYGLEIEVTEEPNPGGIAEADVITFYRVEYQRKPLSL